MAISKTNIINKSLLLIGASPITSIDDGSNTANLISGLYEISLKSVLSECKWNFATKRSALSTSSTTSLGFYDVGETIIYDKPSDMVRIFDVSPKSAVFREEGDLIISDSSDLAVRYVYYLEDTTKYSIYFIDALADRLASEIAFPIVNDKSLTAIMMDKYEKISLPKAKSMNSQTGKHQVLVDDAWEVAKYFDTQHDS